MQTKVINTSYRSYHIISPDTIKYSHDFTLFSFYLISNHTFEEKKVTALHFPSEFIVLLVLNYNVYFQLLILLAFTNAIYCMYSQTKIEFGYKFLRLLGESVGI